MKVYVGTSTRNGHVAVDGPHHVTAHGGRWFVYIPQAAGDPITRVRIGSTPNFDTMVAEQLVKHPAPEETTAFLPAFRAVLTMRGNKVRIEVTDTAEVTA
ncbi:hypothetical protein [Arthrobacter sp. HY1533]|uniref:hypothetical protein n=1 Tax=Arthrobacter sp. HY1533 TaxID=2970919 RepID=UPI0022BA0603|nr:hypothetical protein [Arthrobacter sp. HY1533]